MVSWLWHLGKTVGENLIAYLLKSLELGDTGT